MMRAGASLTENRFFNNCGGKLFAKTGPILLDSNNGEPIDIPVDAPEEQMTERMTLYEIIETLEERDKRLITLRYFQGKTQTETAEQLDMTQVQVSRREKKLLLMMRAMFNQ